MKKILLGSLAFFLFAISISILQTSCDKDANAQSNNYILPPATNSTLGGVIVGNGLNITSSGLLTVTTGSSMTQLNKILFYRDGGNYLNEIWIANYDGTGQTKINIDLPQGCQIGNGTDAKLSPDGKKVFFGVWATPSNMAYIYSCNIDGSDLTKIIDGTASLQGAY